MSWQSWSAFLDMGGYALYVWGAFCVTIVVLITEVVLLNLRRRNILRHLGRLRPNGDSHEAAP